MAGLQTLKHCPWRVYACARETREIVLVDRLHFRRRRSDAAQFRTHAKQVEAWQRFELTDVTAKVVIYEAFVEGKLEAPKHLACSVQDLYSSRGRKNFSPARSGVSNRFFNSGRLPNWENSLK
jgi:hypothetical protein